MYEKRCNFGKSTMHYLTTPPKLNDLRKSQAAAVSGKMRNWTNGKQKTADARNSIFSFFAHPSTRTLLVGYKLDIHLFQCVSASESRLWCENLFWLCWLHLSEHFALRSDVLKREYYGKNWQRVVWKCEETSPPRSVTSICLHFQYPSSTCRLLIDRSGNFFVSFSLGPLCCC